MKAFGVFGGNYCRRGDRHRGEIMLPGSTGARCRRGMGLEGFEGLVGSRRDRWGGRFDGEEEIGLWREQFV